MYVLYIPSLLRAKASHESPDLPTTSWLASNYPFADSRDYRQKRRSTFPTTLFPKQMAGIVFG